MDINLSFATNSNTTDHILRRELDLKFQRNQYAFAAGVFRERMRFAKNLYKTDLKAHFGCVNAIEFSHGNGKYLASGGDDKRVLIWDIEKGIAGIGEPRVLDTEHSSNIFCLDFDRHNDKVLSGGNDDQVISHDFRTGQLINVFRHEHPVYGVSIDPKNVNIFATACEDGKVLIYDQRKGTIDPSVMANLSAPFHAVQYHPAGERFLVTANSKTGAAFWDIRKSKQPLIQFGNPEHPLSCMSVRFNSNGSLILALRRRLPPILYNTNCATPVCTFYHPKYYNSCTMKSCSFAGENDEFVLSGSDDFNLYVWSLANVNLEQMEQWVENTQMVLYGHRSIVNQVRYNKSKCLIASSGVEKLVKLWSPFAQKGWTGSLLEEATCAENPRTLFSPTSQGFYTNARNGWGHMSHDYSSRNTAEDPRMMAFFDTLIQQEIEAWDTHSSSFSASDVEDDLEEDGEDEEAEENEVEDEEPEDHNVNVTEADEEEEEDEEEDVSQSHTESDIENDAVDNVEHGGLGIEDDDDNDENVQNAPADVLNALEEALPAPVARARINYNRYGNRIGYLIAKKRPHLRRLAMRGACAKNYHNVRKVPVPRLSARIIIKRPLTLVQGHTANDNRGLNVRSAAADAKRKSNANTDALLNAFQTETTTDESEAESSNDTNVEVESRAAVASTSKGITSGDRKSVAWNRYRQFTSSFDDSAEADDDDDIDNQPSTSSAAAHRSRQISLTTRQDIQASIDKEISAMAEQPNKLPQIIKKYNNTNNNNATRGRIVCLDPNASISNCLLKRRVLPNGCNNNDYWSDSSEAENSDAEDVAASRVTFNMNGNRHKRPSTESQANQIVEIDDEDDEIPTVSKRRKLTIKEYMEERLEKQNGHNVPSATSTDNNEAHNDASQIEHYQMLQQITINSVLDIANGEQTPSKVADQNGNTPRHQHQQQQAQQLHTNSNGYTINVNANGNNAATTKTVYWHTPDSGISMSSVTTPLHHSCESTGAYANAAKSAKKSYVRRIYQKINEEQEEGEDEEESDSD